MNKKICVIIPTYNEALNIRHVITEIKKCIKSEIVVIDDGSKDNTAKIAKLENVVVITCKKNKGSGKAIQKGLRYVLAKNFQIAIQLDGDGQHNPCDIAKLLKKMIKKNADVVIGSRFIKKTNYKAPIERFISIKILSWILRITFGIRITDPTSGFRAINKTTMRFLLDHYSLPYPEALSIAALTSYNFKVEEASVTMRPRFNGKSSLNTFKGFKCLLFNIIEIINYRFKTIFVPKNHL